MRVTGRYSEIIWLKSFFDHVPEQTKTMSSCLRLSNPTQHVIGSIGPDALLVVNKSSASSIKHLIFEIQLLTTEC